MARKLLENSVKRSIKALPSGLTDADEAAAHLAATYARTIDDALRQFDDGEIGFHALEKILRLGPPMLTTLKELGATPAARAALQADVKGQVSSVDQLRAKRAARAAAAGES